MKQNADGTEEPAPNIDPGQVEQEGRPVASGFGWLDAAWSTASDIATWLHEDPPDRRWLLVNRRAADELREDGVLPMGKVGMLAAEGGAGKTMALVQLALAVAMQPSVEADWFGLGIGRAAAGGRVLLVLGEEDNEDARLRVRQVVKGMGYPPEALAYLIETKRLRIIPGAGMGHRLALVDDSNAPTGLVAELLGRMHADCEGGGRYSLVILDPASRFSAGQIETDNGAATAFVSALERLTKAPGQPTVLIAHHTSQNSRSEGKAAATHARGVTGLTDGVRWHAGMTPHATFKVQEGRGEREVRTVSFDVVKSNYAPLVGGVLLERGAHGVLVPVNPDDRERYRHEAAVEKAKRELEAKGRKAAAEDEAKQRLGRPSGGEASGGANKPKAQGKPGIKAKL